MSSPVSIKLPDINTIIEGATKQAREAIRAGTRAAARRLRANLVEHTPKNLGQLQGAWNDTASQPGSPNHQIAEVFNTAPYAGIVEEGARPHNVNQEGREAIALWVRRKLGVSDEEEIEKIVEGICWKLKTHGQKPTYFVRNMIKDGTATRFMEAEINRHLSKIDPRMTVKFRKGNK